MYVVVANTTCLTVQIKVHENQRGKGLSLAIAFSTIQVTVRFHPSFQGEHSEDGQGPHTSPLFPPTSRENLQLDGYLEYPHATKALRIYKQPCFLRNSSPDPTAQQSASLTLGLLIKCVIKR
ncbi:hypothetical protein TNCV_2867481 [Trichonephila clavipes]|nr:hypothetical protein TNCV_2867481 [Trichonephila clavipes]